MQIETQLQKQLKRHLFAREISHHFKVCEHMHFLSCFLLKVAGIIVNQAFFQPCPVFAPNTNCSFFKTVHLPFHPEAVQWFSQNEIVETFIFSGLDCFSSRKKNFQ